MLSENGPASILKEKKYCVSQKVFGLLTSVADLDDF
jgi:hypothetical protein